MKNQEAAQILQEVTLNVDRIDVVTGGINSKVYKVSTKEGRFYALKLYPPVTANDKRHRAKREIEFLLYMQNIGIDCVPRLVEYSFESNWSLIDWVDGSKPETCTPETLKAAANFISKINQCGIDKTIFARKSASDAFVSIESICNNILKRFDNALYKLMQEKDKHKEVIEWLKNVFSKRLAKEMEILTSKAHYSHWCDKSLYSILSPSDVGTHNMLNQSSKYFFIDFEYAGRDDLSKTIGDWILNPNHNLDQSSGEILTNELVKKLPSCASSVERYQDCRSLIVHAWCLIMLKKLFNNEYKEKDNKYIFERARTYYTCTL